MTYEQVAWASLHDWFIGSRWTHGDCYSVQCRGDTGEPEVVEFDNYSQLREWAGY
jgi:hypothetical protein